MSTESPGDHQPPQFTLRSLFVIIAVVAMLLGITLPAIRAARDSARTHECQNNLKSIGISLHNYLDRFRSFPLAYTSANGQRLHSWRLGVIPYLYQPSLEHEDPSMKAFGSVHWDKPWDDPVNAAARACPFDSYFACPADAPAAEHNWTSYAAVTGTKTAWPPGKATQLKGFREGASNSIVVVEAADSHIHLMEPRDLEFDKLDFTINGPQPPGISGNHNGGANVVMADGSVRCLPTTTSPDTLMAMLDIRGEDTSPPDEPEKATPAAEDEKRPPVAVKPLTEEQLDRLLKTRLDGGMGFTFAEFSNMFLVKSRISLPFGVGLMPASREISEAELQPVFPEFYKPTLRELLDAIALQTSSEWKYDPTGKYIQSEVDRGPVEDLAIFEFTQAKRKKPFQVDLPKGWKSTDKGNWVTFVPPVFPLGMDIHEVGSYSSDDKNQEKELLERVPIEVSLLWARRAKDDIDPKDLKPAKVGRYDALYFETMMPLRDGPTVRWRQWVFMVDHRCYFIVSTILPELEAQVFPGVESMLKSFQVRESTTSH